MKRSLVFLATACLLVPLVGCNRQSNPPAAPAQVEPQAQQMPADVQALAESYTTPEPATPSTVQFPPFNCPPILFDTSYDIYAVTFLWGQLPVTQPSGPPSVPPTDWSGKLWINGVAEITVAQTIRFEPGQDSLVPSPMSASVAWVSQTSRDFDGISVIVFMKRGIVYFAAPELTFETAPKTVKFYIDQLVKLDAFYLIDNMNALAVHARKIRLPFCPHGLTAGLWIRDSNDRMHGHFEGKWMDRCSQVIGDVRGTFGPGDATNVGCVFEGVYTGPDGNRLGMLKGNWFYDDLAMCPLCGDRHGRFRGIFTNNNAEPLGIVEGEFGDWTMPSPLVMPFKGVWTVDCRHRIPGSISDM